MHFSGPPCYTKKDIDICFEDTPLFAMRNMTQRLSPSVLSLKSTSVDVDRMPTDGLRLHCEPQPRYQIILVGGGPPGRPIAQAMVPIRAGDLILLGPHLPHVCAGLTSLRGGPRRQHRSGRSDTTAVVVQFSEAFLGRGFLELPEAKGVKRMLDRSRRGLAFPSAVRRRVGDAILGLGRLSGLQRTLGLAEVLRVLAASPADTIAGPFEAAAAAASRDGATLEQLTQMIHERLSSPIRRGELASAVGLSERTLSRMFRSRFGQTLPRFVNLLRVSRARELLLETTDPITRIAEDCGFQNLSNFNVQFQRLCGVSPGAFRRDAGGGTVPAGGERQGTRITPQVDARRRSRRVRARATT